MTFQFHKFFLFFFLPKKNNNKNTKFYLPNLMDCEDRRAFSRCKNKPTTNSPIFKKFVFSIEMKNKKIKFLRLTNNNNPQTFKKGRKVIFFLRAEVEVLRRERFEATCAHDDPNSTDVTVGGSRQLKTFEKIKNKK